MMMGLIVKRNIAFVKRGATIVSETQGVKRRLTATFYGIPSLRSRAIIIQCFLLYVHTFSYKDASTVG